MENTKDINWADVEKELRKILKKNAQARKRASAQACDNLSHLTL